MTEQPAVPVEEAPKKKSSKTWLIVVLVLLVVCCLCVVGGSIIGYLYNNGDEIFGLTGLLAGVI
jgi:hypothetical protein